jgi:hypothetical protein
MELNAPSIKNVIIVIDCKFLEFFKDVYKSVYQLQ